MDKEIQEGNKLIAKFMGATPYFLDNNVLTFPAFENPESSKSGTTTHNVYDLKYHSSWDWLMPVVEKIESAGLIVQIGHNSYCSIYGEFKEDAPWDGFHVSTDTDPIAGKVENKINGVWLCVVQFIQWHNSNQPQQ